MYSKTPTLKKTTAQITMLASLIAGALLIIFAGKMPLSWLAQAVGVILLTLAIYILSCYLLREYIYSVEASSKADCPVPDFIIYENKGYKKIAVCRLGFDELVAINKVDKTNRKKIREERKNMRRFRYNAQYAANCFIEVRAKDDISVFITYDRELFDILSSYLEKYGKKDPKFDSDEP